MLKELKYLFFIITIILFIFFTISYYFSDDNKKNSYRSFMENDNKIYEFSKVLIILKSDTNDIVAYKELVKEKNKKSYNFWKLIDNDQ